MNFIWSLIKWIFNLFMVLLLCGGLIAGYMAPTLDKIMVSSLDELTTVPVTILSIDSYQSGGQRHSFMETIVVREYPERSFMILAFDAKDAISHDLSIKPDDKVDLFIKKGDETELSKHGRTYAYGVRLADGQLYLDPKNVVDIMASKESQKVLKDGWKTLVAISLAYFFLCLVFSLFRRKK